MSKYNLRKRKRISYEEENNEEENNEEHITSNDESDYQESDESDESNESNESGEDEQREMIFLEDEDDFVVDDNEIQLISLINELKDKDQKAYTNLLEVEDELEGRYPNIIEILKTPLRTQHRCDLVELYKMLVTDPRIYPYTEEWLVIRDRIQNLYKLYKKEYDYYLENKENFDKCKELSKKFSSAIHQSDLILKNKILTLNCNDDTKAYIYNKYEELKNLKKTDGQEYTKLRKWIVCASNLPFDNIKSLPFKKNKFSKFLRRVSNELDKELYGMKKVKEQILLFLNTKLMMPDISGCSLGLIGPPGVGKTTIARCLARILKWPFEQISFGGVSAAEFLKGHDFTYVGSGPGEIVRCMQKMKYKNGILFFDEYEKISENKSITSLLLHVTDFQQNHEFKDNYLNNIKVDLSKLWFIYSMNGLPADSALKDRIYKINIPAYTLDEKVKILLLHVLPKTLTRIGLKKEDMKCNEENARYFISKIDKGEAGIRNIEQNTKNLVNKLSFILNHQNKKGELKGFDSIQFNINQKLSLPLDISKEIVDTLCEKKERINPSLEMMYM